MDVNLRHSESIAIFDHKCVGADPKGQDPTYSLQLSPCLPNVPKLTELKQLSPLVQHGFKEFGTLQRRKSTTNTNMYDHIPKGLNIKRLSIPSSQSLRESDKAYGLNHRRSTAEQEWNIEKRISGLEGLLCDSFGINDQTMNQEDLEIDSEVMKYGRPRRLDDCGKFNRRHSYVHPYKNNVPELFCQKPTPRLQYHQKRESIRPSNSMELGYSKDVAAGYIENAPLPKDPLALECFMRWCNNDGMNEMRRLRHPSSRSNSADNYWSPVLNHGLDDFDSKYDDVKQCDYRDMSYLISDKRAKRNHDSITMSSNKIIAPPIAGNNSVNESWPSRRAIFSNNKSLDGGKMATKNEHNKIYSSKHSSEKKSMLAEIDKIFEIFIPAMRANVIQPEFVTDLINLHKNNEISKIRELNINTSSGGIKADWAQNKTIPVLKYRLHPDDLLAHFYNLGQCFKTFACMDDTFKDLCDGDQKELLNENSSLFIMVTIHSLLLSKSEVTFNLFL